VKPQIVNDSARVSRTLRVQEAEPGDLRNVRDAHAAGLGGCKREEARPTARFGGGMSSSVPISMAAETR